MCPLNGVESLDLSKGDPVYYESTTYRFIKKQLGSSVAQDLALNTHTE